MSAPTIKSVVKSIAVASILGAGVALAASGTPANAAARTASATPASPASASTPEAATYFTLLGTKSSWTYQCVPGTQYGVLPVDIGGVQHVNNGCSGRVYLHQYKGGGGWSYCISPHAQYAAVPANRTDAYGASESTSTAAC